MKKITVPAPIAAMRGSSSNLAFACSEAAITVGVKGGTGVAGSTRKIKYYLKTDMNLLFFQILTQCLFR